MLIRDSVPVYGFVVCGEEWNRLHLCCCCWHCGTGYQRKIQVHGNWYMYCFNNYYQILIKNYCNSSRLKYTLSSYTCTCSWRIIKPTNFHCLIYLIDDIEEPERCQQSDPMGHVSFPRLHKFEWRLQGSTQISFNQK